MYFCFDTETTGLPVYTCKRGYHNPKELDKYDTSRVVSISWIISSNELNIIEKASYFIKPDGYIIPEQSIKIHGITNEKANEDGVPIKLVLDKLVSCLHLMKVVVAHNVHFDVNVLKSECYRYGYGDIAEILGKSIKYCTMDYGKNLLALSKNPKLSELYEMLYDEPMLNAHDAEYDTYYCYKCFEILRQTPLRDPNEIMEKKKLAKQKRRQEHNNTTQKRSHFLFGSSNIELDDEQRNVVFSEKETKATLILAVAGSGKTTTIVCRIKHLVDTGVPEDGIILTTFTRDAANEMEKKLELVFGYKPDVIVGTIDSLALKYVKTYKPNLLNNITNNVGEYSVRFHEFLKSPDAQEFYKCVKHLFVDEFQDINNIQYKIIKEFYKNNVNITCVGDDAQNIYTFRGSDIKYILNFKTYFENCQILKLCTNYRSSREIVNFANATLENNEFQIPKTMISFHKNQTNIKPKVCFFDKSNQQYEYLKDTIISLHRKDGIKYNNIAVLCPQNSFLYQLEEVLTKNDVPNVLLDGKSDIRSKVKENYVCLSTIHKSKGLEWDVVFLLMMNDEIFPSKKYNTADICESRRLFYVGVTRPKKLLYITYAPIFNCSYICRFVSEIDGCFYQFYNYRPSCIGISHNSYQPQVRTLNKIIEQLDGNDYITLKNENIIYDLEQTFVSLYKNGGYGYPEFVIENDICSDFGNFLILLLMRMLGNYNYEQGKLTIACVKMNYGENVIYQKYKANFQCNLSKVSKLGFTDVFANMSRIIKELLKKDEDCKYNVRCIESDDVSCILSLLHKMYVNASKYNVPLEQIPLFTDNFLPQDFESNMQNALSLYSNNKLTWQDILTDVWDISKCDMIVNERRRRLLYKNIKNDDIKSCMDIYTDMYKYLVPALLQHTKNQYIFNKKISPELEKVDLLGDDTCFTLLCSNDDQIKAEHTMQLLCYKSIIEENMHKKIKNIGVVNILKGKIMFLNVEKYEHGKLLCKYLMKKMT